MSLTSTRQGSTEPRRRTCLSSMALRTLLCTGPDSESISSRKSVPPDAASNSPGLARLASVKAPASKPKSSASSMASGMAAQLTSTNGPCARGPLSCIARATRPLPVPVSPCSRTVGTCGFPGASKAARWVIWARKLSICGAFPRMAPRTDGLVVMWFRHRPLLAQATMGQHGQSLRATTPVARRAGTAVVEDRIQTIPEEDRS